MKAARHRSRGAVVALSVTAVLAIGGGVAVAQAPVQDHGRPAAVINLDDAKARLQKHFGDHVDADGVHQASLDSPWGRAVERVDDQALDHLKGQLKRKPDKPALVLDIDDTMLSTYSYGASHDFAYHDAKQSLQWALDERLPVIQPTLELATWAHDHGISIFTVTGRPEQTRAATLDNLRKAGYPEPNGAFFQPAAGSAPDYLYCASSTCTTTEYKSGTRAHIEAQGYDILASVGDQYSDLKGGHAKAVFKLDNPQYVIP
ncbi:HAD family acid phosphatase [Nonomuraea terrae]|uniref:HAD family acid phosphatase n=1 Tax=Nonomuraea terrae TaxID=2530383 RepID=UPI0037A6D4E0